MSEKPAPKLGGVFANALASSRALERARGGDANGEVVTVAAGMHNSLECPNCGAGREHQSAPAALACRYCGTALTTGKGSMTSPRRGGRPKVEPSRGIKPE